MRIRTILLLSTLLCTIAQAEDIASKETDWASLEIDLSALKTWGTKEYTSSLREPGSTTTNVLGTASLSTELLEDAIVLKDRYLITYRGQKLSIELHLHCSKDNFLSPQRIESKGDGGDEVGPFVATVANGKATVRAPDGRERIRDLPQGTITTAAMARLVTLVPRIPGRSYTHEYSLEASEMNLKKKYLLTVLPPETITIGKAQVECSKFKVTGGGIRPVYYWVSTDGVLQRLMMDDRKVIELKETP